MNRLIHIIALVEFLLFTSLSIAQSEIQWVHAAGQTPPWPARSRNTSVVFDNKIWVIGGYLYNSGNPTYNNDVWFSPNDDYNWYNAAKSAPWSGRYGHTSVVFNGKIWVIGGYDGKVKNDVWYSSEGINWALALESAPWDKRGYHTSLVFNNKMWIFGGAAWTSNTTTAKGDVWYSSDGIQWNQATDKAPWGERLGHTSAVFNNRMWVIGGYVPDYSRDHKNDSWWSLDGINWEASTESAPWTKRICHSSEVYDGKMWILCGQKYSGQSLNDAWHSSDGTSWTLAAASATNRARYDHASVVSNNKLYIIGGSEITGTYSINIKPMADVWLSSNGTTWTQPTGPTMWSRRQPAASLVFNNQMWVIGDQTGKSDVWHSSDGATWTEATSSTLWGPRMGFASANFSNKMWIMGGRVANEGSIYKADIWHSSDGSNWQKALETAPWSKRYNHTLLAYNNKLWLMGGVTSSTSGSLMLNDVWCSGDGANWQKIIDSAAWQKRPDLRSFVFKDRMWLICGGYVASGRIGWYSTSLWSSTDGINWRRSSMPYLPQYVLQPVVYNSRIWQFGGQFISSNIWCSYDGDQWLSVAESSPWFARSGHNCLFFNNKVWVFGGFTYLQESSSTYLNDVWYSPNPDVLTRSINTAASPQWGLYR